MKNKLTSTFIVFFGFLLSGCEEEVMPPELKFEAKASFPKGVTNDISMFAADIYVFVAKKMDTTIIHDSYQEIYSYEGIWRYNTLTDNWKRMNNFPGSSRYRGIAFNINDTLYYGLGEKRYGNFKDLWKYDFISDSWQQLANFPYETSQSITLNSFSAGNTGYLLLQKNLKSEIWSFNTGTITWEEKLEFERNCPTVEFPVYVTAINNNGYIFEYNCEDEQTHLIKYNRLANSLHPIARINMTTRFIFSLNNKIYTIGKNQAFEFNPKNNTWKELEITFPGNINYAVTTNSKAYLLWEDGTLWEFNGN